MDANDRTKQVAHYIIARAKPDRLGAVKLNKVMWFSDLAAYRLFGRTITGQTSYKKLQFGPVPNSIVNCLNTLIDEGKVIKREVATPAGSRHEYIWLQEPEITAFSADDVDIINQAIDWVCDNHTASSISEITHDALWEEVELGEQIEIRAAAVTVRPATGKHLKWALEQI